MNKVKVLIEGYAKQLEDGWQANSSVVLIKSNDKNIICDPGCGKKELLGALKKEGLEISDIDFVFLTHGHIDHSFLAGIFDQAGIIDEIYVYKKDFSIEHNGIIPGTDLEIIHTPGHVEDHCSLVVKTERGIYSVAGDIFCWLQDEEQTIDIDKPDSDTEHMDMKKLVESRKKIIQISDYIIPGHGKIFKV